MTDPLQALDTGEIAALKQRLILLQQDAYFAEVSDPRYFTSGRRDRDRTRIRDLERQIEAATEEPTT